MSVEMTRAGDVMWITINRPDALNALNAALLEQLAEAFDALERSDARAVIITGAGEKAFCAGADVSELVGLNAAAKKRKSERGQQLFARLDRLPIPSVALVNGYAFGGGLELALACTFRLATTNAKLALPEIKLGIMPGYGGTQRLPRLIGEARALDMIMTGRRVDAEEALSFGLVNRILDGAAKDAALSFAQTLTAHSGHTLGLVREATAGSASPLAEGLALEAELSTRAFSHPDAAEGVAAFLEKRSPEFNR